MIGAAAVYKTRQLGDSMGKLLMVGCGWMGRPYLGRAHARGLDVSVLDTADALGWDETKAALGPGDRGYPVTATDDEGWLAAATTALADGPVAGVLGFSEPHIVAAAMLAEELGLPGPGVRAAVISRNKLMQREVFGRAGLNQPEYLHARDVRAAESFAAGRYPVVLKPLSSMGSLGVRVVADPHELRAWVNEQAASAAFLVEEYLDGPEFSVEALIVDGAPVFESVTAKTTTVAPCRVELAHHVPASLDAPDRQAISTLLRQVIGALGMRTGVVHFELILRSDGPHIVEIATRTPGDYLMDVIQAATDVDLYDAAVAAACGLPLNLPPGAAAPPPRMASVWFPTPPAGTVSAVEGVERVEKLPGVVKIEIDVAPGDEVHELRSSMDRVGMVVYQAPDRQELDALLARVRDELRIAVTR
ncbi:argininosuccinate lyase [Streptomyces chromofuscus]|nr:argininosuccinate lyase [Streptomyces chromofuscus]